ncbi:TPA: LOW QUALITY PROTEIN: hypothetical protein N0F65_000458, partial [Lagenidium giganteum]
MAEDPLVVGVTSCRLLFGSVEQAYSGTRLFHCDATYKTNSLDFHVITCSQMYHLAAILILSHVRSADLIQLFSALDVIAERVCGSPLRATSLMTDADDAQLNALLATLGLSTASPLMCFTTWFVTCTSAFVICLMKTFPWYQSHAFRCFLFGFGFNYPQCNRRMEQASVAPEISALLQARVDRRSLCVGKPITLRFATTNNPCKTFNAKINKYTKRKLLSIHKLMKVLATLVSDTSPPPMTPDTTRLPVPTEIIKLANDLFRQ